MEAIDSSSLPDFLRRRAARVHLGDTQSNPFQPDLFYRGFAGSPVLGASQGLSVFQDGVRLNEFFADTVNWDLVPEEAMGSVEVLAGADPRFGRNTLGGAILFHTKSGRTDTGTRAEISGGASAGHKWYSTRQGAVEAPTGSSWESSYGRMDSGTLPRARSAGPSVASDGGVPNRIFP
jgi:outer membrane cobalamin receptor